MRCWEDSIATLLELEGRGRGEDGNTRAHVLCVPSRGRAFRLQTTPRQLRLCLWSSRLGRLFALPDEISKCAAGE